MNYIVLDLEWNQPFKTKQMIRKPVTLYGEIIQIGAVKLDENYHIVDTFKIMIKPVYYTRMCKKISKLTKITNQDLEYGYEVEYTYEETYDEDGFLTASRNRAYAPGSYDTRSTTTYTYDDLGGLLAEATFTQGEKGRLCTTTVYTYKNGYDDQGRLIQALRSCHMTTVDMAGNASSSFSKDSWVTVYEYDSKGRTVSKKEGSRVGEWMNIWTWTYDKWDNLQNYSLGGETLEEYIYVPLSQAQ